MWKRGIVIFLWGLALMFSSTAFSGDDYDDPSPSLELGAKVYVSRCVLCHGNKGMGEGIMPMRLKDYPETSLLKPRVAADRKAILEATVFGALYKDMSQYMPPFGKELSWTELESVSDFIVQLRTEPTKAYAMLEATSPNNTASRKLGQQLFNTRCVLCHGQFGEGDGRMAKLLKTPPPADLTASRLPEGYLRDIISKGGEAMGRSKHMPPWGDQLFASEISSIILYLISIRD